MNKAFIQEMKEQLEMELAKLFKDLTGFATQDEKAKRIDFVTKFPEFGDDDDENASEIADYSNKLPLESALEKELRDIQKALANIAQNKYGICKYCKSEISEDRLRARPTSTSCIACKKTLTQEM